MVGRGKNPRRLSECLLAGRSVVIVGEFGFGKSYLASAVAELLRIEGVEPVTLLGLHRDGTTAVGGSAMAGGLDDALSFIAERIEVARPASASPLIVQVDDAQTLHPRIMRRLTELAESGTVTLLLTSTPVALGSAAEGDHRYDPDTVRAINELWIERGAERVDVAPLTAREADELLAQVMPDVVFDTVSRALIFANSGGSPQLIKELAAAVNALDPNDSHIAAFSHLPAQSPRILDLLQHQLRVLTERQLTALAALHVTGPIPLGVLGAAATRGDLRVLSQHGFIASDYASTQLVVPGELFAGAAFEIADPDRVHQVTGAFGESILRDVDHLPSPAQAMAIAGQWGYDDEPAALAEWGEERVAEVLLAAASGSNRLGEYVRAERFALRSRRLHASVLADVERSRSLAQRGRQRSALTVLAEADVRTATPPELARLVIWWAELAVSLPDADAELSLLFDTVTGWVQAGFAGPCLATGVAVVRANLAGDQETAIRLGEPLLRDSTADLATRIVAGCLTALLLCHTGHCGRALDAIDVLDTLIDDISPATVAFGSVDYRAKVRGTEAVIRCTAGFDVGLAADSMVELLARPDALDDRYLLAAISMVAALVALHEGHDARATVELRSAQQRLDPYDIAGWRPWMLLQLALVSARRGDASATRRKLAASVGRMTLDGQHAWFNAILAFIPGEGADTRTERDRAVTLMLDQDDQMGSAVGAWGVFELFRLGAQSERVVDRLERVASLTDAPLLHAKAAYARAFLETDASRLDAAASQFARMNAFGLAADASRHAAVAHAALGDHAAAQQSRAHAERQEWRRASDQGLPPAPVVEVETTATLTRRELEVATLAATGRSDREIAQTLFLSVRTVESHLYQARLKLGVASRRGLAAALGVDPSA